MEPSGLCCTGNDKANVKPVSTTCDAVIIGSPQLISNTWST